MNEKFTKGEYLKEAKIKELQMEQEALIKRASHIDDEVISIKENGLKGTEVSRVYLDPTIETQPFGTMTYPYHYNESAGIRKKSNILSFDVLKTIARRVEPISAIIRLRCNQVGAFSHVSIDKDVPGFHITLRDPRAVPTPEQRKEMRLLEHFFENTGYSYNPDRTDNFEEYQKRLVRDRLTLDAIATQVVANKHGQICEFWAMEAGSIFFATEDYVPHKRGETYQPIKFVQEIEGQVRDEFTALELAYGVANPSTDLKTYGYGESEIEVLLEAITAYLYSREYNKTFFTKNSVPPGLLTLIGDYKEEEIQMFRRQWAAQLHGVQNSFRVPIIVSKEGKGADFKNLKTTQKDAEFMKWMDFLIRIITSVYQVSPEEINFTMGASGSESPVVAREGGQRILHSKEKGLVPLLRYLQNYYNKHLVYRINPLFKFEFTGIEFKDKDRNVELKKKRSFYMSINELRREDDLEPLDINKIDNIFDLPIEPAVQNAWLQIRQAKIAAEMAEREALLAQQSQEMQQPVEQHQEGQPIKEQENQENLSEQEQPIKEQEEQPVGEQEIKEVSIPTQEIKIKKEKE